jgi:hypothetical protein
LPSLHLLTWIGHWLEASRFVPLGAAIANRRTGRFIRESWMVRLEAYLVFDLLLEAGLLGLALRHTRNYWLHDLALLPFFVLGAWVLAGLNPSRRFRISLFALGILVVLVSIGEASRLGLYHKWTLSMILASVGLMVASVWELGRLFSRPSTTALTQYPAFWFLIATTLDLGTSVLMYAGSPLFLAALSAKWIGIPWAVNTSLGVVLRLILTKAFLCPKPRLS